MFVVEGRGCGCVWVGVRRVTWGIGDVGIGFFCGVIFGRSGR